MPKYFDPIPMSIDPRASFSSVSYIEDTKLACPHCGKTRVVIWFSADEDMPGSVLVECCSCKMVFSNERGK